MGYDILKHARVLELDKVLALLSTHAALHSTREEAILLVPSVNYDDVLLLNRQTDDAYSLVAQFGTPSFGTASNCDNALTRAEVGGILTMKELLDIGELLRVVRSVKTWREHSAVKNQTTLDDWFFTLTPNKYFEEKIFLCIKSEEEMSDNASPTLADIRRKIRNASLNIRDRLDKLIKNPATSKYLQDSIITQRQGRFVVPVKAEHKGDVSGLVHDTSSSGATLFVEPMAIVEVNNEIKLLQSKEREEIERILFELSSEAAGFAHSAKLSYRSLISLDLVFAKANLGFAMRASMPIINQMGELYLKNARHPLIPQKTVVPVTVGLGKQYSTLVITGPNTGGKTVTLKTIGLLTLMTMCGLMIPADDGSEISVFQSVLADIGDEQSIEQSLSTFSSHMNNITSVLRIAGKGSLVLFDELCAGTDPVEGAALAEAILIELKKNGAVVGATTHYAELKSYALEAEGVENACCEFDVETLRPTYKLLIGIPGRSNAFAISKRLGLSDEIVEQAQSLVSSENMRFESIVGQLEKAHVDAEKDRTEANVLRSRLEYAQKSAAERLEEINKQKEKIIEKARSDAQNIIDYARAESNRLLNELETLKKQLNKENTNDILQKAKTAAKQGVKAMESNTDHAVSEPVSDDYQLPRPLIKGDLIKIKGLSKEAIVDKPTDDSGYVVVVMGNMKTKVKESEIVLLEKSTDKKPRTRTVSKSNMAPTVSRSASRELDIRGMASDEAILELDQFIDNCVLSNIETVTIIHGKGTGVLRDSVRSHLKHHKSVQSFRPGVYGEGENGVTIVSL